MADETPSINVLPASNLYFMYGEAGHAYAVFEVTQPVGHTVEDALRPEYWTHHARKLKAQSGRAALAGSVLTLRTEDHAHYAELYVRAVLEGGLVVQLLREPVYLGIKQVEAEGFEVRWNPATRKQDVIRRSDGLVMASSPTKEAAKKWIDETTGAVTVKAA